MSTPERLPLEEARAMLSVHTDEETGRQTVHTQMDGCGFLMGADWDLDNVEELLASAVHLIPTTGMAKAAGKGLLAVDANGRRIFLETEEER